MVEASLEQEKPILSSEALTQSEALRLFALSLSSYESASSREDFLQALHYAEESLHLAQEIQDRRLEGYSLYIKGQLYTDALSRYHEATEFLERAFKISGQINDPNLAAHSLMSLSYSHVHMSNYEESIRLFDQALVFAREASDNSMEAMFFIPAYAHVFLGNYQEAIQASKVSLASAQKHDFHRPESHSLGILGLAYLHLGAYDKALDFSEQSLAIAEEKQDHLLKSNPLFVLGAVYTRLGQYEKGVYFSRRSVQASQEFGIDQIKVWGLVTLASSYLGLGNHEEVLSIASETLQLSRRLGDRQGEVDSLSILGYNLILNDKHSEALSFFEKSLSIAHEIGYLRGKGNALNSLGTIYYYLDQFATATETFLDAITVFEDLRSSDLPDAEQISFFDTYFEAFLNVQRSLVAQNKVEQAFTYAERGRARAFVELLSTRVINNNDPEIENLASVSGLDLFGIQQIAKEQNATLVTYSIIFDKFLFIWVVQPTGEVAFQQVDLENRNLSQLVGMVRDAIGVRGDRATIAVQPTPDALARQQAETEANLRQLYDLLIAPIADLLPTDPEQPVVFMPQDELFLVPFAALKAPDGQYLIENHTILTSPSIQVFGLANDIARRRLSGVEGNALIVGNPTMPTVTFLSEGGSFQDVQLSPLPGAQREAEAISGFLQTPALLGSEATRAAVKQRMAGADVIHLATHGLLEYGDPRQTGTRDFPGAIALAPGGGDNGLLTAAEILQMDLRADLAVLSACDTGRGRVTGDGVVGLSRAFVAAGVPSIIVSLWAVDDQATADLMVAFYDHWQQSGDKAQALRQAMLTTMQQHPDPRLWSAFTLIGSPQ